MTIFMVSDDNPPFVAILHNLSLFSFLAKSVDLNGLPVFLGVTIAVDNLIPRLMSHNPFKPGLFESFVFFTACKKIK